MFTMKETSYSVIPLSAGLVTITKHENEDAHVEIGEQIINPTSATTEPSDYSSPDAHMSDIKLEGELICNY